MRQKKVTKIRNKRGPASHLVGVSRVTPTRCKKVIALLAAIFFTLSFIYTPPALAETITVDGGTIDVNTQDSVTNWDVAGNPVWNVPEFNVPVDTTHNISGLNEGASLALLVGGGSATNIFGTMNISNLDFILQNVCGINVGATGLVNVTNANFIASTLPLNLDSVNFLAHQYEFAGNQGFLMNEGRIVGHDASLVALVANAIENKGTIEVPMGTVALASGDVVTVGISGDGMVTIGVDAATANELGLTDQVKNLGAIQADGGKVTLTAKALDGLFEKAINIEQNPQAVEAIRADDGTIEFVTLDDIYNNAIIQAMEGEIKIRTEPGTQTEFRVPGSAGSGDVINDGTLEAVQGSIEIDATGNIETRGILRAETFREHGATFGLGGIYEVGHSYHDNLDGALTLIPTDVGPSISGTINDIGNIIIEGGTAVTLTGDTTFNADSNANANGIFTMDAGSSIAGGGYNLTIYSGQNRSDNLPGDGSLGAEQSVFKAVSDIGTLTLNSSTANNPTPGTTTYNANLATADSFKVNTLKTNYRSIFTRNETSAGGYQLIFSASDAVGGLQYMDQGLGTNYRLANNIDASETSTWNPTGFGSYYGFDPIGNAGAGNAFSGNFDGNKRTISGLTINRGQSGENDVGLFGYVDGASIQDVGIIDIGAISGFNNVGALAGQINNGTTISRVYVDSPFVAISGVTSTGGLVGKMTNLTGVNTIENTYAKVDVSGSGAQTGGLVGLLSGAGGNVIKNSYATGAVSGAASAGGLVGEASFLTLTNSYATGAASGAETGGLVGTSFVGDNFTNNWWFSTNAKGVGNFGSAIVVGDYEKAGAATNFYGTGSGTGGAVYDQPAGVNKWDFATTWEAFDNVYPRLQWEGLSGVLLGGTVTNISNGTRVALSTDGQAPITTTVAGGAFSFGANILLKAGSTMLIYADSNGSKRANIVTVVDGTAPAGLNLYEGRLALRHDNSGAMTNAILGNAWYNDTDVYYSVSGSTVTFQNSAITPVGINVWLPSSQAYTPGGNVNVAGSWLHSGTVSLGSKTLTIDTGNFRQYGGTFDGGTGKLKLYKSFILSGGTFIVPSGEFSLTNDFTVTGGTYSATTQKVTFVNKNNSQDPSTITYPGVVPGIVEINKNNNGHFTVPAGTTINLGNNPTTQIGWYSAPYFYNYGTINIPPGSTWTLNGGATYRLDRFLNYGTINHSGNGWNINAIDLVNRSGGTINYAGSSMYVELDFVQSGTFDVAGTGGLNNMYIRFDGSDRISNITGDFSNARVDFNKNGNLSEVIISNGSKVNLGESNPAANITSALGGAGLTNNGTLTIPAGKTWTVNFGSLGTKRITNSGTITHSGTGWDINNGSLINNNGATITYAGTNLNLERDLYQYGTLDLNGKRVILDGARNSTVGGNVAYGGTLRVNKTNANYTATFNGGVTLNNLEVNRGTLNLGGNISLTGDWLGGTTGRFNTGTRTVTFNGGGTQRLQSGGTDTFHDFTTINIENDTILRPQTYGLKATTINVINGELDMANYSNAALTTTNLNVNAGQEYKTTNGSVRERITTLTNNGTVTSASDPTVAGKLEITTMTNNNGSLWTYTSATGAGVKSGTYDDLTINSAGQTFTTPAVLDAGGALTVTNGTLAVGDNTANLTGATGTGNVTNDDTITINNGTLDVAGDLDVGTLTSTGAAAINVAGNVSGVDAFNRGTSTVTLDGAGAQSVTVDPAPGGTLDFWDLSIINAGRTVSFGVGETFNIWSPNTVTVTGAAGNPITLQGTVTGDPTQHWNMGLLNDPGTGLGNWTLSNVTLRDLNNTNFAAVGFVDLGGTLLNLVNGGNNAINVFSVPTTPIIPNLLLGKIGATTDRTLNDEEKEEERKRKALEKAAGDPRMIAYAIDKSGKLRLYRDTGSRELFYFDEDETKVFPTALLTQVKEKVQPKSGKIEITPPQEGVPLGRGRRAVSSPAAEPLPEPITALHQF